MKAKIISNEEEIFNELLDEREFLISSIDISEQAISFWENQMEKVFAEIDENEENSWHPDHENKNETHLSEVRKLMSRGKMEIKTVSELEKRCDKLYYQITEFLDEYGRRPKIKRITKRRVSKGI